MVDTSGGETVTENGGSDSFNHSLGTASATDTAGEEFSIGAYEQGGDTGSLPQRMNSLEDSQADLAEYVWDLSVNQQSLAERIADMESGVAKIESEVTDITGEQSASGSAEDLSESIFRTITGTGAIMVLFTAIIWAILAPSILIIGLLIPGAFFAYSYSKGTDVMHE